MRNLMMTILLVFSCTSLALAQDDYHKVEVYGGYSYNSVDRIAGSELISSTSNLPASTGKRKGLNGFDTSFTYNFSRYIGAKFDVSGHYGDDTGTVIPSRTFGGGIAGTFTLPAQLIDTRLTSYNFMGGVQIKDNSKNKRVKPFAHVLLGMARQTVKYEEQVAGTLGITSPNFVLGTDKVTNNGFSWALGGGLDIRVHRRIDIRVIQFDYNPVRTKEQTVSPVGHIINFKIAPSLPPSFVNAGDLPAFQSIGIQGRTQHNFRIGFGIVFH
ncbi:MAG TPA: outer membrane beta-barrel protein [Pyrinomonadaceae bacterium]|nr:outer membrane beta-barrel protein [Pyrinomonadaceae bacterium]